MFLIPLSSMSLTISRSVQEDDNSLIERELYLRTGGNSCMLADIMPAITPHEFVSKWKRAEAREWQSVQEHFIDLCRLVGHWPPGREPQEDLRVQAIAQAAWELVEQRDRWLKADPTPGSPLQGASQSPTGEGEPQRKGEKRTLTHLYNARPTWLNLAHKRLDEAVFAAYGWKSNLTDEETLEKLLSLNLERAEETR
jgi:hypothetical protein